jgi:hypothetical protein
MRVLFQLVGSEGVDLSACRKWLDGGGLGAVAGLSRLCARANFGACGD